MTPEALGTPEAFGLTPEALGLTPEALKLREAPEVLVDLGSSILTRW